MLRYQVVLPVRPHRSRFQALFVTACLVFTAAGLRSEAQGPPAWPPTASDGNLVAGSGSATVNGHAYTVSYDGLNSSNSLASGLPTITLTASGICDFSIAGVAASPTSVTLDDTTSYHTTAGTGGSLDRLLTLYCRCNASYPYSSQAEMIGYPFIRYKVTTSDPAVQNGTVTVRVANGVGGQTICVSLANGNFTATTTSDNSAFSYPVYDSLTVTPFHGNSRTTNFTTLWVQDEYCGVTLSSGVGYFWASMTPHALASVTYAQRAESTLYTHTMPISIAEP